MTEIDCEHATNTTVREPCRFAAGASERSRARDLERAVLELAPTGLWIELARNTLASGAMSSRRDVRVSMSTATSSSGETCARNNQMRFALLIA